MKKIEIEINFAKCVKEIGGQVLDEILKNPQFKNADYWFPEHETVGELKRFNENLLEKKDFQNKVYNTVSSWKQRGLVSEHMTRFNLREIPEICANEYLKIIKRRIESSVIKKANLQIRETKEHLGSSAKYGLLIIVNDNNKLMKPDLMLYIINNLLKNQHSNINSIIYLSANLPIKPITESQKNLSNFFWIDGIINNRNPVPKKLRENLQVSWIKHCSSINPGELIYEFSMPNDINIMKSINFK